MTLVVIPVALDTVKVVALTTEATVVTFLHTEVAVDVNTFIPAEMFPVLATVTVVPETADTA